MAPGSFECLLQTTSSMQDGQQQEEEVKSHITSPLHAPSWPFVSQFQVFSVFVCGEPSVPFLSADNTGERETAGL